MTQDAGQLKQTSPRKNGKPSISGMVKKIESVIQLFFEININNYYIT